MIFFNKFFFVLFRILEVSFFHLAAIMVFSPYFTFNFLRNVEFDCSQSSLLFSTNFFNLTKSLRRNISNSVTNKE